jgi:hypothetical protein
VPSTTIAQLEHGKATLTQNEIQLPTSTERARYLQITWPRELSEAVLTSVRVRPAPTVTDVEVQWRTLPAEPTDAKSPVRFDTHALFPIEFVQVEFVDSADVVYARVLSRADPASDWTLRHEGFFYGLADPGGTVRNPPARVRRTTDRYWSLETSDEQGRRPDRMPRVRVGWYPHELVFVAGGSPPYTLAYGNAETHATKAPVDALLTVLEGDARTSQAVTATIDEPRTVAGARALKPAFSPRRIALWGILLGVVALLAILAVRVFRDSSATS